MAFQRGPASGIASVGYRPSVGLEAGSVHVLGG